MKYLQFNPDHPPDDYWDQTLIKWIATQAPTDHVVVIPGAYQAQYIDEINKAINKFEKCLVVITSDEEAKFPAEHLYHPNMQIWRQYGGYSDQLIPIGPAPGLKYFKVGKTIPYFFAGQVNTDDRKELSKALENLDSQIIETNGFGQGLPHLEYMLKMSQAKIVPCPSGPYSPDSFRLYEALEAHCTPVVNNPTYFSKLFGKVPFPYVDNWDELEGIEYHDYFDWWQEFKEGLVSELWIAQ